MPLWISIRILAHKCELPYSNDMKLYNAIKIGPFSDSFQQLETVAEFVGFDCEYPWFIASVPG